MVKLDGTTVYADGGYCGCGPKMSNNVAEYSGVAAAMTEAEKYEGRIIIRGDSKLAIMQLQGKWKVKGGLYYPFYLRAREVYARILDRVKMEWIPRVENDECDFLSKQVLKDRGVIFRIQQGPLEEK
jgi:ribonuclease HI